MSLGQSEFETRASLLMHLRDQPENQTTWAHFVSMYGPMITSWCRAWGLQDADADDVTQTVLLKLAHQLKKFQYDSTKRFRGFLHTIAHHAWVDLLADRKRTALATGDTAILQSLDQQQARDDLAQRLEQAYDHELLQIAQKVVQSKVESHTWEAFILSAVEGSSGAEVAARLNMQVGTVFKARSKVQKMLKEEIQRLEAMMETAS